MKHIMETIQSTDFFFWCNTIFSYKPFVVLLLVTFIACKIFLLIAINRHKEHAANLTSLFLFTIPLVTYTIGEINWVIVLLTENVWFTQIASRIAWHTQPLQYYAMCLFLWSIATQKYILSTTKKLFLKTLFYIIPLPFFSFVFPYILRAEFPRIIARENFLSMVNALEHVLIRVGLLKEIVLSAPGLFAVALTMIFVARKIRIARNIPYILRLQIQSFFILLSTFLVPEIMLLLCKIVPRLNFLVNNLPFTLLSSALLTASLMFYARRIYQLRFLNLIPSVHANKENTNNAELRKAKQALCAAQSITELHHINTEFFDKIHGIDPERVIFSLRTPDLQKQLTHPYNEIMHTVDTFIHTQEELVAEFFTEDSVLVYDELAFTHFYQQSKKISILLNFLNELQAAVFIPLRQGERILGFIMIKKHSNRDELFPQAIQTQMGLYGTYVTYTIMRLEQYQYKELLSEQERLSLELHKTKQKVARYQESLSSIMKIEDIKKQGIVLCKTGAFTFINTAAEELVQINPNIHHGHPLCKALKEVVRRVTLYGNPHAVVEKNMIGQDICCHGFPYKKDEVFILISPADIMRTLKIEHMFVKPSDIDYLVFLHSTEAGTLINTALPGKGEILQKFKIQFLKTILSKKSMVFDVHPDDLNMFLGLAQRILTRQTLHTIDIQETPAHDVICKKLFGAQTFNVDSTNIERGLLDRLGESGILCIHNAHLLDLRTQDLLAQYMKTGSFTIYKSEQRIPSNAMIILSCQEDIQERTKNGLFSKALFEQIQGAIVPFAPLTLLPFAELESLAEGIQKQMIAVTEYHHLFGFSIHERELLDSKRPCSVHELQQRLRLQLKQKMKQGPVVEEVTISRPSDLGRQAEKSFGDPILIEAARLGKQALRDRKIMRALWEKLKSQSKIAQLLDVDRSSVHRRCKEFGVGIHDATAPDIN